MWMPKRFQKFSRVISKGEMTDENRTLYGTCLQ